MTTKVPVELFSAGAGFTIGDGTAEDTKIVFDGNAQDYYIGLDDSADKLIIGSGSTVGTNPAITIDESQNFEIAGTMNLLGFTGSKSNFTNSMLISNDAGTAMGAALILYHELTQNVYYYQEDKDRAGDNLYLGPAYDFTLQQLKSIGKTYQAEVKENVTHNDVVDLITDKNIVAIFQGRSENGPRALGNRSLLYDPTDPKGKDHVNEVKRREYFRPFAGTILEEDVHEWFDLRGMESSPTMMYAVNCKPGVEEKIPAIIHVDGTCRIQTVNEKQNKHYYDLIKAFKEKTGCPIVFNTSFNLGGEPLVETLDDALRTLKDSKIEYLYLPEYNHLFKIENE